MLTLVKFDDPVLTLIADTVSIFDDALKSFTHEMIELVQLKQGLGLAAPQVGVNKRIIVLNVTNFQRIMVNPKILSLMGSEDISYEGCLSLGNLSVPVKRKQLIKIEYQDVSGIVKSELLAGISSRVFQHELDHLNGITLLDKVDEKFKSTALKLLKGIKS